MQSVHKGNRTIRYSSVFAMPCIPAVLATMLLTRSQSHASRRMCGVTYNTWWQRSATYKLNCGTNFEGLGIESLCLCG